MSNYELLQKMIAPYSSWKSSISLSVSIPLSLYSLYTYSS